MASGRRGYGGRGVALDALLPLGASRIVSNFLLGAEPNDPATPAISALTLVAVAIRRSDDPRVARRPTGPVGSIAGGLIAQTASAQPKQGNWAALFAHREPVLCAAEIYADSSINEYRGEADIFSRAAPQALAAL